MYIEGSLKSGKTSFLAKKFVELINSGVSTSEILIITLNSYKKRAFTEKIFDLFQGCKITGLGELPVYTFSGIVRSSLKSYWSVVEEIIPDKAGQTAIIPNLCGLELSELFIKLAIKEINEKEFIEDSLRDYQSHRNLKHQILRRHTLIANNHLDNSEIMYRSKILKESMGKQAQEVLEKLKKISTSYRSFDYLKQITTFLYLLDNRKINFDRIKYVFVDDFDELTFSAQFFIKKLIAVEQLKDFYIAADPVGSSRRGYLCANYTGYELIKTEIPSETLHFKCEKPCYEDANNLFEAITNNKTANLANIKIIENSIRHVEMLEMVFSRIKMLINNEHTSPDDITVVIPSLDNVLKYALKEFFEKESINYQFLTGSKKIFDAPLVFGTLIILQLINEEWKFKPKPFEIRSMLTGMLQIPTVFCEKILDDFGKIIDIHENEEEKSYISQYNNLIKLVNTLKKSKPALLKQVEHIFNAVILPNLQETTELEDYNNMVKSLREFEKLTAKIQNGKKLFYEKDWLILMKDTVVSDNPAYAPELKENSVKIATAQKVIDFEIESKIQIWLDVSDNSWIKDDTGPLYNAWVFHKNWQSDEYTAEIHKKLTHEKTAHMLRKLVLLSNDKIYCYASQLNPSGAENDGGIESYLSNKNQQVQIKFEFTPREDQAPVLEYNGGKMAIAAVPGAGKTKILEALIIKMMNDAIDPDNILVLTYMDSAVRNIRERIKNSCPELVKFPLISTIHGLALSIIKQDSNHVNLNLDSDFDICDESIKFTIMYEIYNKLSVDSDYKIGAFNHLYPSVISQCKLMEIAPDNIGSFLSSKKPRDYKLLFDFLPVYTSYQAVLKHRNMIDFDDLLIESVKILKNNAAIRKQYQEKFKYIIEDEAQDSTSVQQELLEILSDKHGNLIRCGDPNQAITSSFSTSNAKIFINYIESTSSKVIMYRSQRCAEEVFELANSLIDWAQEHEQYKKAFNPQTIKPVAGKNPETKECLNFNIYETPEDEKAKLLQEIEKLRKSGFKFSIGILLRTNSAVINWAQFLDSVNIPYICYSESVAQKKVFRFIKAFLEVLNNPWRNDFTINLYKEFTKVGIFEHQFDSAHFLEKAGSPFVSFPKYSLPTENLAKFQDEIIRWLDKSVIAPEEIICELGSYYFDSVIDKSNARIISLLVGKFRRHETDNENNKPVNLPEVLDYLNKLGNKKSLGGVKFFNEIEKDDDKYEFVQLMTVHKAKGLEFDAVFMPEMQEKTNYGLNYSITPENIQIDDDDKLKNQVREIKNCTKSEETIKLEKIHEHLRLIYVGITRARHYLYMSGNGKEGWSKTDKYEPSKILLQFIKLQERIAQ